MRAKYVILFRTKQWSVYNLLIEKPYIDLSNDQQDFICYFLKFDVHYFQQYDMTTIRALSKCLKAKPESTKAELIQPQDELYIIANGAVKTQTQHIKASQCFFTDCETVSEKLQCLVISKSDLESKITYFTYLQKRDREPFIQSMFPHWSMERQLHLNS